MSLVWEDCSGCQRQRSSQQIIAFVLFLISVALQFCACEFTLAGPIQFQEQEYNNILKLNILGNLTWALRTNHSLHGKALEVCQSEHASVHGIISLYYVVMFVWVSRMVQELSDLLWLIIAIGNVPNPLRERASSSRPSSTCTSLGDRAASDGDDVAGPPSDDEEKTDSTFTMTACSERRLYMRATEVDVHVTSLTLTARLLMFGTVGVLRFMTYVEVQWVGIKFLVMSKSACSVVLKCLAFQWILAIPEGIFSAAASDKMRNRVKNTSLLFVRPRGTWMERWDEWLSSVVRLSAMFAGTAAVFLMPRHGFRMIMALRYACQRCFHFGGLRMIPYHLVSVFQETY